MAVVGVAEEAAVNVTGNAVPGVRAGAAGDMATPDGSPETVIVTMLLAAGAVSSREAC